MPHDIHIIGGGLAGSEAAWQLARRGWRVRLSEMRGTGERSPAHQTDHLAELVCSNSLRSDDHEKNAVGLLHHEMRACDSLIMAAAEKSLEKTLQKHPMQLALEMHEITQLTFQIGRASCRERV